MFSSKIKIIFRNDLFIKTRHYRKHSVRLFASGVKSEDPNVVKAPHPSLSYPQLTIDQYIWKDLEFWKNKTAIVRLRSRPGHFQFEPLKIFVNS